MLYYVQQTGRLYVDQVRAGLCYSGQGLRIDDPAADAVASVTDAGPLPRGVYTVVPVNVPHLGGNVYRLDPATGNQMHGRSAFYIHWDNSARNFTASEGCIVPVDFPTTSARIAGHLPKSNQLTVCATEADRVRLSAWKPPSSPLPLVS